MRTAAFIILAGVLAHSLWRLTEIAGSTIDGSHLRRALSQGSEAKMRSALGDLEPAVARMRDPADAATLLVVVAAVTDRGNRIYNRVGNLVFPIRVRPVIHPPGPEAEAAVGSWMRPGEKVWVLDAEGGVRPESLGLVAAESHRGEGWTLHLCERAP
jgi:hypothetical protein